MTDITNQLLQEIHNRYGNPEAFVPFPELGQYTKGGHIMNLPRLWTIQRPVVFDIGGWHGDMIDFYKAVLPNCQVFSFEPDQCNVDALMEKYKDDPQVVIIAKAVVGSGPERQSFTQTKDGKSSALEAHYIQYRGCPVVDTYEVDTITIPAAMDMLKVKHIDYCKINAEAVEVDIIENLPSASAHCISEMCISVHHPAGKATEENRQ